MILRKIKDCISNMSGKSNGFDLFYTSLKYSLASFLGAIWSEEHYARWFYHLYTGKRLDLNQPERFDERVWWLKLNNRDPMLTTCSDKVAVRDYVRKNGLADILIPQIATYLNVDDIDFSGFDSEVVIKCNHNSGGHLFFNPKNPPTASAISLSKKRLKFILHHNAYVLSHEWNYKNIPPKIIVEKVVRNKNGELPLDYKFLCFDGEPKLLFLDLGVVNPDTTYNHNYPRNIYDMRFRLLPVHETRPNADFPVEKPLNFEKMVDIARQLSKPFPFCRVDLYNVDGMIYFGEITFYHGGGCNNIYPDEWDYKIASWIDLNSPKIVRKKE